MILRDKIAILCIFFSITLCLHSYAQDDLKFAKYDCRSANGQKILGNLRSFEFDFSFEEFTHDTINELLFLQESKQKWTGTKPTKDIHFYDATSGNKIWHHNDIPSKYGEKHILAGIPISISFDEITGFDPKSGDELWNFKNDSYLLINEHEIILAFEYKNPREHCINIYDPITGESMWKIDGHLSEYRKARRDALFYDEIIALGDSSILLTGLGCTYINLKDQTFWHNPTIWEDIAGVGRRVESNSTKGFISGYAADGAMLFGSHVPWAEFEMPSDIWHFDDGIFQTTETYIVKFNFKGDTLWMSPTPSCFANPFYLDYWKGDLLMIQFPWVEGSELFGHLIDQDLCISVLSSNDGRIEATNCLLLKNELYVDHIVTKDILFLMTDRNVYKIAIPSGELLSEKKVIQFKTSSSDLNLKGFVSEGSYLFSGENFYRTDSIYPDRYIIKSPGFKNLVLDRDLNIDDIVNDVDIYEVQGVFQNMEFITNGRHSIVINSETKEIAPKYFSESAFMQGAFIYDTPSDKTIEIFKIKSE